ncbi:MAG: endonuclease domain-containing protein, partial [Betaproteobacteria bacterium]
ERLADVAASAPCKGAGMGVRSVVAAARKLRRNSTEVERKLWHRVRDKQIEDFRFRRQRPIGKYIVDFVCLEANLIIELDGSQHADAVTADAARTQFLESLGYRVLRFWNNEVLENIEGVLERIREVLVQPAMSNPTLRPPLGRGGSLTPSPAKRGVEQGFGDACVAPAERLADAAASAPCKGVGMGVRSPSNNNRVKTMDPKT